MPKSTDVLPSPLPRCPLVPDQILKDHNCFFVIDTRFRKAARLLQVLWLKDRNIEPGIHVRGEGDDTVVMPLHSNLSSAAAARGLNFLSPDIHNFVRREMVMAEEGAAYDRDRLFSNALSSQPMTFNILAPLALDLDLASRVFKSFFPDFVASVENIHFEHSPWRRVPGHGLEDGTAFDAAVKVVTPDGEPATIYIETKYSEDMSGPAARWRNRYDEVAQASALFVDPDSAMLKSLALEQLFREHLLAQECVDKRLTSKALFVAIGPRLNRRVMAAFRCYQNELNPDHDQDSDRVPFVPLTLEEIFTAIELAGAKDLSRNLHARYTDFDRVYHLCVDDFAPQPTEVVAAQSIKQQRKRALKSPTKSASSRSA